MGLTGPQIEAVAKYNMRTFHPKHDNGLMLSSKNTWKYSAIIGEVDIIDCVLNHDSIWAEKSYEPANFNSLPFGEEDEKSSYVWNWVLANPVLYDKPILNVKGALSLWEYERPYEVIGTAEMVEPSEKNDVKLIKWSNGIAKPITTVEELLLQANKTANEY